MHSARHASNGSSSRSSNSGGTDDPAHRAQGQNSVRRIRLVVRGCFQGTLPGNAAAGPNSSLAHDMVASEKTAYGIGFLFFRPSTSPPVRLHSASTHSWTGEGGGSSPPGTCAARRPRRPATTAPPCCSAAGTPPVTSRSSISCASLPRCSDPSRLQAKILPTGGEDPASADKAGTWGLDLGSSISTIGHSMGYSCKQGLRTA